MASNRMLRDWTDSESINELSSQAEVLFTRLIMKADDYGSFHANPKLIKAYLFPLRLDAVRDADISRWTTECEKAGLILVYTASDKQYLRIIEFGQRLRNMRNKFPDPSMDDWVRYDSIFKTEFAATCGKARPEVEEKKKKNKEIEEEDEGESDFDKSKPLSQEEIDFKIFQDWILKNAPQVAKLSKPFTLEEFLKIKQKFGAGPVSKKILEMENKKGLTSKYTSAYLTCNKWLTMDYEKNGNNQQGSTKSTVKSTDVTQQTGKDFAGEL